MAKKAAGPMAPKAATPVVSSRARAAAAANARAAAEVNEDGDEVAIDPNWPKAMYKKMPQSKKYPNGYETKRAEDEKQATKLAKQGFVFTTDELGDLPAFPYGHED